jgi:serine/threonine protein kinase
VIVSGTVKLIDFGLSCQMSIASEERNTRVFTLANRPLELIYYQSIYSFEVDIWALGTVFLEIETGVIPFYWKLSNEEIRNIDGYSQGENCVIWAIAKLLGSPSKVDCYKDFPYSYKEGELSFVSNPSLKFILQQMLCYNPLARLSADEVVTLCQYL